MVRLLLVYNLFASCLFTLFNLHTDYYSHHLLITHYLHYLLLTYSKHLHIINMPANTIDITKAVANRFYNKQQVAAIAEREFPSELYSILDVEELAWSEGSQDPTIFCARTIFLGYIQQDGGPRKVSAYMRDTGCVELYAQHAQLGRRDFPAIHLLGPWAALAEKDPRAKLERLFALCAYYFLEAGLVEWIWVKKPSFFTTLKIACVHSARAVAEIEGEGGEEADGLQGSGGEEEAGSGGGEGVGEDDEDGEVDVVRLSRTFQSYVALTQFSGGDAEELRREFLEAWPQAEKFWC